jgi:hypothetical protein
MTPGVTSRGAGAHPLRTLADWRSPQAGSAFFFGAAEVDAGSAKKML